MKALEKGFIINLLGKLELNLHWQKLDDKCNLVVLPAYVWPCVQPVFETDRIHTTVCTLEGLLPTVNIPISKYNTRC